MRMRSAGLLAGLAVSWVCGAAFGSYTVTTPGGNWNGSLVGQNFSPSIDAPSMASDSVVLLSNFTFTKSGNAGLGTTATYLVLMEGAYPDTNGEDNATPLTTVNVLAVSSNSVNTLDAEASAALSFDFAQIPLIYSASYTVAFASINDSNVISFHAPGVLYVDYADNGSGVWLPTYNYGGAGNYSATSIYADFDGDGYLQADGNTADAAFSVTFAPIPEPMSAGLLIPMWVMTRRSRR